MGISDVHKEHGDLLDKLSYSKVRATYSKVRVTYYKVKVTYTNIVAIYLKVRHTPR